MGRNAVGMMALAAGAVHKLPVMDCSGPLHGSFGTFTQKWREKLCGGAQ